MQLLVTLTTILAIAIGCTMPTVETAHPSVFHNCPNATRYSVKLCIEEDQTIYWTGLWDECFNLGTQTTWAPELGSIKIRSKWRLCEYGFRWKTVQYQCPVPLYTWSVEPQTDGWLATIAFPPNECLAEAIPNCYDLTIYGSGCPY